MKVRVFALLLTTTAIVASIVATAISTRTAATVSMTPTNETAERVVNSRNSAERLPPGSIDGSVNPESIPDEIAYSLLFRLLAQRDTKEENAKIRSYIKLMNVTDAKGLLSVVDEFERRVGKLDRQAEKIHEKRGPNLDSQALARLNALEQQKNEIIADIVQTLPGRIDVDNLDNLRTHIKERVKRNVKMIPEHVHQ